MDKLFNDLQDNTSGELYEELAPLYEFIYSRHYNYKNQKELIDNISTENTTTILEGACGTGKLTELLVSDYDNVISVDYSKGMISQAKQNVPNGNFIQEDLEHIDINKNIDLYSILGTSIIHMTDDSKFKNVANKAYDMLNKNGSFVFDFMKLSSMDNGNTGEDKFFGDDYTVIRKHLTTQMEGNKFRFNFSFKIIDNDTNKFVRTSESILMKAFEVKRLTNLLYDIGFDMVEFKSSPKNPYGPEIEDVIIATK